MTGLRCILYSELLKNSDLLQKKTKSKQTNRKAAFNLEQKCFHLHIQFHHVRLFKCTSSRYFVMGFLSANMAGSILEGIRCWYHLTNPIKRAQERKYVREVNCVYKCVKREATREVLSSTRNHEDLMMSCAVRSHDPPLHGHAVMLNPVKPDVWNDRCIGLLLLIYFDIMRIWSSYLRCILLRGSNEAKI